MRHTGGFSATRTEAEGTAHSAIMDVKFTAKANVVNRTHRVVRERARTMQASRSRMRDLMLPMALCSALMIMLFGAVWMVLDQYEIVSLETTAPSHHFFMLLLWFLPVSAALVAMVWFRLSRNHSDAEAIR